MPVEDVLSKSVTEARGGCEEASPGEQAPVGALPGVPLLPLKKEQKRPKELSWVLQVGGYPLHEHQEGRNETRKEIVIHAEGLSGGVGCQGLREGG